MSDYSIQISGQVDPVKASGEVTPAILNSKMLQGWLTHFATYKYILHEIRIDHVDFWGNDSLSVVSMRVMYSSKNENDIVTRRVVLTHNSVACLIRVVNLDKRETFVALVCQDRVAVGYINLVEALAGRVNKGTDEKTQMLAEIKEEAGLVIHEDVLEYLGTAFSSCGIISEKISYFMCSVSLSQEEMDNLEKGTFGVKAEHESTQVRLYSSDYLLKAVEIGFIEDQKLLALLGLLAAKHPSTPMSMILNSREGLS